MKDWLLEKWQSLNGDERTKVKQWGSAIAVTVIVVICYYVSDHQPVASSKAKVETIEVEKGLLEEDIHSSVDSKIQDVNKGIAIQDKKIDALKVLVESVLAKDKENSELKASNGIKNHDDGMNESDGATHLYPQPPAEYNTLQAEKPAQAAVPEEIVGGIGHVAGESAGAAKEIKKKKQLIFLPPSFMTAKLLTGIDAMTTELGQSNPETIILRVQAPAVLPNSLKTNLKGCFVVANALGNLAKERVQVRLVSLHCMAINGKSVIDQKIKGFVADQDGKRDMSGIVVTKAGSNLARSFMAGLAGGFGETVALSSNSTYVNPLGAMQVVNPKRVAYAGVGSGLKSASRELQQYYLDLAKQAAPVIEVGAAKDVTVVIQEGVPLEIKDFSDEDI